VDEDSVGDHTHECDEVFYVLEGRMTFRVDSTSRDLETGGFVFIPRGTRHGFDHSERARYLVISSPGGLENYFAETEEAENRGGSDDELREIARRYGTRFLD
jgi:quercetin dioxygenase-like cupin family protein